MTEVTAVVVAYGEEPLLEDVVAALLDSEGVEVHVRLVDNICSNPALPALADDPRVTLVSPGTNTGFAGGCNLGARGATTDVLVFVNSDAVVHPAALAVLAAAVADEGVGLVCGKVLLHDRPDHVNSVGNPVHYSLLSWAGGWGDRSDQHTRTTSVGSITGCLFASRRSHWQQLGGFHELLFAYGEDVEVSLRTWMAGRSVLLRPDAVAWHHYEFSRNPQKMFWLERNRWVNLLTVFETRTLVLMLPALVALDAGILAAAVRAGWGRGKLASYRWLLRHRDDLRARRALVQDNRVLDDRALFEVLVDDLAFTAESGVAVPAAVNRAVSAYGRWIQRRLDARSRRFSDPPRRAGRRSRGAAGRSPRPVAGSVPPPG